MRRSKYQNLGILDALERLMSGGKTAREYLYEGVKSRNKDFSPRLFSRQLYSLKTQGFIRQTATGSILLSEKGRQRILIESLDNIVLHNKKTDGYRRIIMFDIPERRRSARNILREKLREFECKQLQKSVYITPYICENEIREVARILKVGQQVHVFKIMPS